MDGQQSISIPVQTTNLQDANPVNPGNTKKPVVSKPVMIFAAIVGILMVGVIIYGLLNRKNPQGTEMPEVTDVIQTVVEGELETSDNPEGNYMKYSSERVSAAGNQKIALVFTADWCVTCKQLDIDILNNISKIPEELLILKVNYDTDTQTNSNYNVDFPHTIILVDNQGNELKRWTGSLTLDALLAQSR